MHHSSNRQKSKSPRLVSMLDKKRNLRSESESDLLTASDSDSIAVSPISTHSKTSITDTHSSSERNCCLICSILPSLSTINCCSKHLTLLTTPMPSAIPTQIVYMMPSANGTWSKTECHCIAHCSKSKRHHRSCSSSSSSSSSSGTRHRRKKRSVSTQSSNTNRTDDVLLSSNVEENTPGHNETRKKSNISVKRQLNHVQPSLSTSSSEVTNMNRNKNARKSNQIAPSSITTRSKQRNTSETESITQNGSVQTDPHLSTSSELIELDSELSYTPRIRLHRVTDVKNDGEGLPTTLNMSETTKPTATDETAHPKIFLKRVMFAK